MEYTQHKVTCKESFETEHYIIYWFPYRMFSCMLKGQYHGRYHDFGQKFTKFKL